MTTVPCKECKGAGFVSVEICCLNRTEDTDCCGDPAIDYAPCPRIRCIAGQIELTDAKIKAIEARECNERT